MRGSAIETSRSRNSYIRAPRSVTRAPTDMPSRSLKLGDRLARLAHLRALAGDRRQLLDRGVERLGVRLRLADAHVQRDLGTRGACMIEPSPSSSLSADGSPARSAASGAARRSRWSRHRSISWPQPSRLQTRTRTVSPLHLLVDDSDAGRLVADGADEHHVRDVEGRRLLDDPARNDLLAAHAARVADRPRLRVPLDHVEVLDDDAAATRACLDNAATLAAVLPGEDLHEIPFLDSSSWRPCVRAPLGRG